MKENYSLQEAFKELNQLNEAKSDNQIKSIIDSENNKFSQYLDDLGIFDKDWTVVIQGDTLVYKVNGEYRISGEELQDIQRSSYKREFFTSGQYISGREIMTINIDEQEVKTLLLDQLETRASIMCNEEDAGYELDQISKEETCVVNKLYGTDLVEIQTTDDWGRPDYEIYFEELGGYVALVFDGIFSKCDDLKISIKNFINLSIDEKEYPINSKKELEDFILGQPDLFEKDLDVVVDAINEYGTCDEVIFSYYNSDLLDKLRDIRDIEDEEVLYDELDKWQNLVVKEYKKVIDKIFDILEDFLKGDDKYELNAYEQYPDIQINFYN